MTIMARSERPKKEIRALADATAPTKRVQLPGSGASALTVRFPDSLAQPILERSRVLIELARGKLAERLGLTGPGIQHRLGQQVLHAIRRRVPGLLSDRPAVLARQIRRQPQHERSRPPTRLHPDIPSHRSGFYAMASSHRKIITSRHKIAMIRRWPPRIRHQYAQDHELPLEYWPAGLSRSNERLLAAE
jgi:hypothetical protein